MNKSTMITPWLAALAVVAMATCLLGCGSDDTGAAPGSAGQGNASGSPAGNLVDAGTVNSPLGGGPGSGPREVDGGTPGAAATDGPRPDQDARPMTLTTDAGPTLADAARAGAATTVPGAGTSTGATDAGGTADRPTSPAAGDGGAFATATCNLSAFRACGGNLVGTWDIAALCEGGALAAKGEVTFHPNNTYSFLVLASQGTNFMARPVPEEGTYSIVDGTRVMLKATKSNGAYFPNRGSLAYRTDIGHTSPFCVTGDMLELDAGRLARTQSWLFRKRP
jgi:hypothetical protein